MDFGGAGSGGLLNLSYQNNAVSYLIGLHGTPDLPQQILSGDRHMRVSSLQSCGLAFVVARSLAANDTNVGWTNLHNATGNLLFSDGSVQTTTSSGLRQAITNGGSPNDSASSTHVLIPSTPAVISE